MTQKPKEGLLKLELIKLNLPRTMSNPNIFGQVMPEMPIPFTGYPDPQKGPEGLQNLYGKINIQVLRFHDSKIDEKL